MSLKPDTTLNDCSSTWIGTTNNMTTTSSIAFQGGPLGNPLVGSINPKTYRVTTEMDYITETPMRIAIHRVANGFVIQTASYEGERTTAHIASTVEEVNEIITTQLVTKKMEGK